MSVESDITKAWLALFLSVDVESIAVSIFLRGILFRRKPKSIDKLFYRLALNTIYLLTRNLGRAYFRELYA